MIDQITGNDTRLDNELTNEQLLAMKLILRMSDALVERLTPEVQDAIRSVILNPHIQSEERLSTICTVLGVNRETILPDTGFVFKNQKAGALTVTYRFSQKLVDIGLITQEEIDARNLEVRRMTIVASNEVRLSQSMSQSNEDLQLFMINLLNDSTNYLRSGSRKIKWERNYDLMGQKIQTAFSFIEIPTPDAIASFIKRLPDEISVMIAFNQINGPRSELYIPGKIEAVFTAVKENIEQGLINPREDETIQSLIKHLSNPLLDKSEVYYGTLSILGINNVTTLPRTSNASDHMRLIYGNLINLGIVTEEEIYNWQQNRRRYWGEISSQHSREIHGEKINWYFSSEELQNDLQRYVNKEVTIRELQEEFDRREESDGLKRPGRTSFTRFLIENRYLEEKRRK